MEKYRIDSRDHRWYPPGVTAVEGGFHFSAAADKDSLTLLLYRKGREKPEMRIAFPPDARTGSVWDMTLLAKGLSGMEYCFESDGERMEDPCGRAFSGREDWGNPDHILRPRRAVILEDSFDWQGDRPPMVPYHDCILYRLHPRGFSNHASSKAKQKGTFSAIREKIPYFLDLGVTTLELLPSYEFEEVMLPSREDGNPYGEQEPTGRINYWGYTKGCYFAPKTAYGGGRGEDAVRELKTLVRELHKSGLELVIELYFTGGERPSLVLDAARFWVEEYHVDGIHLVGCFPAQLIGQDPRLSRTKLFAGSWDGVPAGSTKHLAEYSDGFLTDMRRALKGDEDQMNSLVFRSRRNPEGCGVINYMANTNGFTLMDLVSYDAKHNEANGEDNRDGSSSDFSWNCGVEGPTRRRKVAELRKKQIRNALLLLFLSQGTPLLLSGDEFGSTKGGNNNSYCQDNETSWLNWNKLKSNREIFEFTKSVIAFRRAHPVFHMAAEPRIMDYLACGQPDVSYHGVRTWCPEFESFRRQLGILYCGRYGRREDASFDDDFYVAYNFHWEPHTFALPNLQKKKKWRIAYNTDAGEVNGIYAAGKEPVLESQKEFSVPARTIVVFIGK